MKMKIHHKLFLLLYIMLFLSAQLTSHTTAVFHDTEIVETTLLIGEVQDDIDNNSNLDGELKPNSVTDDNEEEQNKKTSSVNDKETKKVSEEKVNDKMQQKPEVSEKDTQSEASDRSELSDEKKPKEEKEP